MSGQPDPFGGRSRQRDPTGSPMYTSHGQFGSLHILGSVPPALSPLDAFAMQGRLLAKRFEAETSDGKRLSRLPPNAIASELAKAHPGYFRTLSSSKSADNYREEDRMRRNNAELQSGHRPKSHYPQIHSENGTVARGLQFQTSLGQLRENERESSDRNMYGMIRTQSPEPLDAMSSSVGSTNSLQPSRPGAQAVDNSSTSKLNIVPPLLAPGPSSLRSYGSSPSIRPVMPDRADNLSSSSLTNSMDSVSLERPNPPFHSQIPRSPSMASDRSFASGAPRPSMNYSRPISRNSRLSTDSRPMFDSPYRQGSGTTASERPSLDLPVRQDSADTPLTPYTNDAPHTPISMTSDGSFALSDSYGGSGPTSYIHSKYSLAKAKRESIGIEEFLNRQINWDGPQNNSDISLNFQGPLPPPQAPPSPALTDSPPVHRRKTRPTHIAIPPRIPSESPPSERKRLHKSRPTTPSTLTSDASTIKPRGGRSVTSTAAELSPEMHLQKGIELHEDGSLQESTYHLRLAARAGMPTAMLLYALACRHGWGMKPNPSEGIMWLQKAVDSAQLEVADDEDLVKHGQQPDIVDRKTHKAQFALSVYELGVSYMNGWGVQQDKSLAVRCFEVAGNWGDADALQEAGFCYMEGIGCKKDLKKAARFYRQAEAKGVILAGNSWIHKEKYLDPLAESEDGDDRRIGRLTRKDTSDSATKKRDKSRTRAFFTRKKSAAI